MDDLQNKLAWIHQTATTLTGEDLVALKFNLKRLIADAHQAIELVRAEIIAERNRTTH